MPIGGTEPLHQCDAFVHYGCKQREKARELIKLDFEHSKEKRLSVQGGRKRFDKEAEISPLSQRTVRDLSEPSLHYKFGADSEKSMAESEGREIVEIEKTLTPTTRRRAESSGETRSLPTVHEGEMSTKLGMALKQKPRQRSISESSLEQLSHTPHMRPSSPHPSSPRLSPSPRSISMDALTNPSVLQRQASENNFRQNRTRKISCPGTTCRSSVKYRESPSPRLLRRSWSTDTVQSSDKLRGPASLQLRHRSYSDSVPQGFARSVELGGPFSPRRKLGLNSPCSSPGLQRRGNLQFINSGRDFHALDNISPLSVDRSYSSPISPKENTAHALVPRTPTPVVSRKLRFLPDNAQNSPNHCYTNSLRRLRPLSPIKMPLDAARDLFNVSPLRSCSGVDILSPETNESHLAQEKIAAFFKKMTIEGSSKDDGKK